MANQKKWAKNKHIVQELVRRSVKTQYRNSVLGVLWSVLNPLLNMLVMWLVFSQIFGKNDPVYPVYLLTGNILFQALRSATEGSLTCLVNNRGLITKVKLDNFLFPLSSTLSSLVNFGFSFISLIIIMFFMQVIGGYQLFGFQILAVVLMLPAFLLFEYGISLFLSVLYVFFRDIKHLYRVFLTLWTYLTPVFYKIEAIDSSSAVYSILKLNPMYYYLTYFRDCVYNMNYLGQGVPSWKILGLLYLCGVVFFLVGFAVYKGLNKKVISYV